MYDCIFTIVLYSNDHEHMIAAEISLIPQKSSKVWVTYVDVCRRQYNLPHTYDRRI